MSHITFKKLVVDAFLSYDHVELTLDGTGITYIKGINNSDTKASSNGSGKSALISESILWCLTGQTSRSTKLVSNLYLDRGASVTVGLDKENHYYEVTRGTHKSIVGNGIFITKDGVSVTKPRILDNEEYLKTELPELDWQVMTSILILSQGLVNGFSTLVNRDRKERLEKLASMESVFTSVKSMADNVYDRLLLDYNNKNFALTQLNAQVNANTTLINSLNNTITSIEARNAQVVSDDIKQQQIKQLDGLIAVETAKEVENNTKLTQLNAQVLSANSRVDSATTVYSRLSNTSNTLTNSINDAAICPTCLQPILDKAAEHVHTSHAEKQATLNALITSVSNELVELRSNVEPLRMQLADATAILNEEKGAVASLNNDIQNCITLSRSISNNIAMYNNQIKSLDIKADSVDVYKTQISELVVANNNLEVKISASVRAIAEAEKQVNIAKWLVAQTTRSIRSYMLEGVTNYINMRCKEYSEYLFDDAVVRLEADGSSLDIYLGDKLVENISGGEHRRLDIILQLAVRDLVMMQVGFTSNILVIDEVFDNLDNLGMVTVLDLITSQREVISSIFLITHKNDADLEYDKILTVEKGNDNISRIAA